jgi:hypothetical protein
MVTLETEIMGLFLFYRWFCCGAMNGAAFLKVERGGFAAV